jgi:DNA polymerase III sliding clamp (beta) subunit (PCNA family)
MLLKEAIQRAAKFIDKGKEAPPIMRALRFIPAYQGMPARVYATNGAVGIILDVGQELPNMALPADPLVKLCKDITGVVSIEDKGNAKAAITVAGKAANDQSTYTLDGLPPSEFPGFPAVPATFNALNPYQWSVIQKVVHAAGKDVAKPELMNVNFRPTVVEATDRSRVARAEIAGPWAGLVPAQLFQNWPKTGNVECVFTDYHCFWKIEDELRFAIIQRSEKYPALEKLIPENHEGWWMVVDVKSLAETVKKAADMSPTASVVLDFGIMGLTIRSHAREGIDFESKLEGRMGIPGGCNAQYTEMLLDGKLLRDALKVVETPKVKLCYGKSQEPLRLESGGLIECLWPMLASQPE